MKTPIHTLIIEDQPELLFSLQEYVIENFRSTITIATSGNDAISLLKRGNVFDLIISDYNMPNGDGSIVFNYVQNLSDPIPFIFYSAAMDLQGFSGNFFLGTILKGEKAELKKLIDGHKFNQRFSGV